MVDEGGGVNLLDDREGWVLTCFLGAGGLFVLAGALEAVGAIGTAGGGEGAAELTVSVALGSTVFFVSSCATNSFDVLGLELLDNDVGVAVIIVANKNTENNTGNSRSTFLLSSIVFKIFHPFFGEEVEAGPQLTTQNTTASCFLV